MNINKKYNIIINNEYLEEMTSHFKKTIHRNCCGKQTVRVYKCYLIDNETDETYIGFLLRHYGAVICIVSAELNLVIENSFYYDYSSSSSNARNRFTEYILRTKNIANTKELQKAEKYHCDFIKNDITYIISAINNDRN